MYAIESEHLRDMRRATRDIVEAIGHGPKVILTWDAHLSGVRELWLTRAPIQATERGGPSWTECVVILLQVSQNSPPKSAQHDP